MKKKTINSRNILRIILTISFLLFFISGWGQNSQSDRDSITRYSYLDYQYMKKQLGILETRPGPSGDPKAPNAANTDESKVRSYSLPDPLIMSNGHRISKPAEWWNIRRPEIVNAFEHEMYGYLPDNVPDVKWKVKAIKDTVIGSYPVKEKTLLGIVDNSGYPEIKVELEMIVGTPAGKTSVPLVMEFGFVHWPFGTQPPEPNYFISAYEPLWKQQLLSQGWGYAILDPGSIQADHGAGLKKGVIGLTNKGKPRTPEQWGTLRAWAWGASKAIDYFETDADLDAKRIAVEGISRYGKAALVAMAFEPRISLGFIGSSGEGGASIMRRNFGEQVENLVSSYSYYWFCGNFIKYADKLTIDDLPVDAHELLALCAPRPVFISVGSPYIEGQWVDAKGMFLAGVHAGPVYELLGTKSLGTKEFPVLGKALTDGEIAYRQHSGGHSTGPNWSTWIAWAHKYWE